MFDLILDLIAHALADEETSTIQVPHHQSVARQKSKLVADFGLMMHLTWARQLLDNREFVLVEGRHPSSDPNHGRDDAGYDSEEEERDLHHQDMYMNGGRIPGATAVCIQVQRAASCPDERARASMWHAGPRIGDG